MNGVAARLAVFAVALVAVFGAALALGAAAGVPLEADEQEGGQAPMAEHPMGADDAVDRTEHAEAGHGGPDAGTSGVPGGLAVSQDGYTFTPASAFVDAGREQDFRFTITGPDGLPVRDFIPEHDKELHLIVVRRDLSGFQHVHPTRDADGTWSIPLTLAEAGDYRAFADFVPAGGEGLTLGVDLHAAGDYAPRPLPAPLRTAEVDGYRVQLAGDLVDGTASDLTLTISRNGEPVTDLEPYLGAYGHLVALRDGDLAYLHVHPHQGPAGPAIAFSAEIPTAGTYRLYLDFQHGGEVRTAEFTVPTGGRTSAAAVVPAETESAAHEADGHTHEEREERGR